MKIVNQIFTSNGFPKCNNLNTDWANGGKFFEFLIYAKYVVLYVQLFNTLFDETYDLKLSTAESVDAKTSNWNKINAVICFNYLQQQFILIGSTMKALAQGKKHAAPKAILCLLECTMGTQFEAYLDSSTLKEIGTVM